MKEKGRGRDDGKGEREVKEKGREGEVKEKGRGRGEGKGERER